MFVISFWFCEKMSRLHPPQRGIDTDTNVGEVGLNFFQLSNKCPPTVEIIAPRKFALPIGKDRLENHQFCRGKLLNFEDVNEFFMFHGISMFLSFVKA